MPTFYAPEVADGDVLGDFQILEPLGRGPLGTTYHAIHGSAGKEVVIKTVVLTESTSLEWLERFEAQAVLSSKLRSAGIDSLLTTGRSGPFWYAVKDLVHDGDGYSCNLRQYIDRHGGKLSSFQAKQALKQMAKALNDAQSYRDAHHNGVLHGNLKPTNVLVGHQQSVDAALSSEAAFEIKLTDWQPYGLYKPRIVYDCFMTWKSNLERHPAPVRERALGHALQAIFRPFDYLAPELRQQGRPTLQGDVFSLGVLAYEMLTGHVPEAGCPQVQKLRPDLPEAWDTFIVQCTHIRADQRFRDYGTLLAWLDEHLADPEPDLPQQEPEAKKVEQPKQERSSLTPKGMIYLPAAEFSVGGPNCGEDSLPQHDCSTSGFYMDRTLVTNAQFKQFTDETGYETEAEQGEGGPVWVDGEWTTVPGVSWRQPFGRDVPPDFPKHPVVQVTYADALEYAKWAGHRLPTEEEWEYAAAGGLSDVRYPWGNSVFRNQANYGSDGTVPVMRYPANGFGLYDMAGNVWEWTSSWYKAYPGNERPNPHFGEKYRVLRGGAWMYDANHCLIAFRNAGLPTQCLPTVGFRCVRDFQG